MAGTEGGALPTVSDVIGLVVDSVSSTELAHVDGKLVSRGQVRLFNQG